MLNVEKGSAASSAASRSPSAIVLPPVPEELAGVDVAAWSAPLVIDSYLPAEPDDFPAFLETRVYQGSSGRIYPLPFHEAIAEEKVAHEWQAVHLENEYVRLVILPELGGRIHIGYDKTVGYDFFYRNNVIKPALVGLAGPWISGGVEFNWPQHHRPGTFLPTDWEIERESDGSVTVWCSDHDPLTRMKGMHGIRLRPGSSVVEARVRLYNRTEATQTFLWWANVAAAVNDEYQSFFPTDVHFVADHAKRAVATFPRVDGHYYGVDYPARVSAEVPDGDRLDWYRNIPVPTSYMVTSTEDDFFGGYDHGVGAGFVHWADRSFAPGKKQWTWGNAPFGQAWDANLTDTDGPYVELMAGAYTDNQPDFSWIAPGETKTFSQYWFPIQGIGPAHQATLSAAVRMDDLDDGRVRVGVVTTRAVAGARVTVGSETRRADIAPGRPFIADFAAAGRVRVEDGDTVLVEYSPRSPGEPVPPPVATEPGDPATIRSADELYLTGQYLEQYRHATRSPEPYWREALRRDPGDVRSHVALAARLDRAGLHAEAESHLREAIGRLVSRVPNPADGEAHYRLGSALIHQGRDEEAESPLGKALWNSAWRVPAGYALARLLARRGDTSAAMTAARGVLAVDSQHGQAACLLAALGDRTALAAHRGADPLDQWARDLDGLPITADAPTLLDVALEYAGIGLTADALRLLDIAAAASGNTAPGQVQVAPLVHYHRALLGAADASHSARTVDARHCLPSRLEDVRALEHADDPRAAMLLGSWYYDKGRHDDAIAAWERALDGDRETATIARRNLGIATYNVRHDPGAALRHFETAVRSSPTNSKLFFEYDQLLARTGATDHARLALHEARLPLVAERDDLTVEHARLLTAVGRPAEANAILAGRRFQPWEGGEGQVLAAWDESLKALAEADAGNAVEYLEAALAPPATIGEARHPLANAADLYCLLGDALAAAGQDEQAGVAWRTAAAFTGDFVGMSEQAFSAKTPYSIRALRALGRQGEADLVASRFAAWVEAFAATPARVDYFATSLPSMLLFHDDLQETRDRDVTALRAQVDGLRSTSRDPVAITVEHR
jgi:tetratricopeptide (TPR) repeat protein